MLFLFLVRVAVKSTLEDADGFAVCDGKEAERWVAFFNGALDQLTLACPC